MLAVVLVILGIGVGMGAVLSTSLNGFYQQMDSYKASLNQQMDTLFTWLKGMGIHLDWSLLKEVVNPGEAMQLVATLLAGFGGVLTNTFLITLTVVFILLEASGFPAKLRAAMKDPKASFPAFERFTHAVKSYLVIKTVVSLATGVAAALWVFLLGLDFPLLWGLLAFLFNYVPTIGSIVAAVPAMLLALVQLGPFPALLVAVGYLCINFIFGSLIEPRFMGHGLGLSTLVVFLSLVFWDGCWGRSECCCRCRSPLQPRSDWRAARKLAGWPFCWVRRNPPQPPWNPLPGRPRPGARTRFHSRRDGSLPFFSLKPATHRLGFGLAASPYFPARRGSLSRGELGPPPFCCPSQSRTLRLAASKMRS